MRNDSCEKTEFTRLQQRLGVLFEDTSGAPVTVVVVPSLTLHPDELRKIPGAVHFEQRLLFEFQLLREPNVNLVYATSERIAPEIVEYALGLVPALVGTEAADRLTLLDCDDDSPAPLTEKVLRRPELVRRIKAAVRDPARAYLVVFNSTDLERELALRLGIPMFSCDPALSALGTKSGGRTLLKEAGVPVPDGFEDLFSEGDLIRALARLKRAAPEIRKAVVKLNDSFAGAGNAVFSYEGTPETGTENWIAEQIATRLNAPGDTWPSFRDKFEHMGGVVERFVEARALRSPSAQLELDPRGGVRVLSTHDQVLGGPSGQTFVGCAFPARDAYRLRVQELATRVGRALASAGVVGQLSVDFVVDEAAPEQVHALEINLRMGGATAPYMFMRGLVGGHYDLGTGHHLAPDGSPRHYVTSDRIQDDAFRSLSYDDLVGIAREHGVAYDHTTGTGAFYYALGALPEFGKLGMVAVGTSRDDAQRRYDTLVTALRTTAAQRVPATTA
ncbi:peptide ligase PGM1-related protein [Saccharothrix longispora]